MLVLTTCDFGTWTYDFGTWTYDVLISDFGIQTYAVG